MATIRFNVQGELGIREIETQGEESVRDALRRLGIDLGSISNLGVLISTGGNRTQLVALSDFNSPLNAGFLASLGDQPPPQPEVQTAFPTPIGDVSGTGGFPQISETELPGAVFSRFLREQQLGGLATGPLAAPFEQRARGGRSALDIALELGLRGAPTEGVPQGTTFGSLLENRGLGGISGFAEQVLRQLGGFTPDTPATVRELADPSGRPGAPTTRTQLFDIAQAAIGGQAPFLSQILGRGGTRSALTSQFEDLLLQGGPRPTFAGFLGSRLGFGGAVG